MPPFKAARPQTYRALFSDRSFRRLFGAEAISSIGDALSRVGLPILIFELTGSPLALGASFAILQLPWILVSGAAGTLADSKNRVTIMMAASVIESLALGVILLAQHEVLLYLGLLVAAVMQVTRTTAVHAALPEIAGHELLSKAVAARVMLVQSTDVAGLLLGGIAIAIVGSRGAIAIDASTFLVYVVLIAPLRAVVTMAPNNSEQETTEETGQPLRDAMRFVWRSPSLKFLSLFMGLRGMAFIGVLPLLVVYVEEDLQAPSSLLAGFLVLGSVGVTLGSFAASKSRATTSPSAYLLVGSAVAGVLLLVMSFVTEIVPAMGLFFLCMVAYSGGNLVTNVGVAQLASSRIRGRVIGLTWSVIKTGQVIGALSLGLLASTYDVPAVLIVSGLGLSLTAAVAGVVVKGHTLQEINGAVVESA